MQCQACQASIPTGTTYCPECGRPVSASAPAAPHGASSHEMRCAHCGEEITPELKFCPSCGSSLLAEIKVAAPGGQMQKFLVPTNTRIGQLSHALAHNLGLRLTNENGLPVAFQLYAEGIAQPLISLAHLATMPATPSATSPRPAGA